MARTLVIDNFHLATQPITELFTFTSTEVIPITANGNCPFLKDDYGCAIYEKRPEICRKFGDESHLNMTCVYQNKDGTVRNKKQFNKINALQITAVNKFLGK